MASGKIAMLKTLAKHGNSYALVIDKPVLDLLGADETTDFEVITDGTSLLLRPVRSRTKAEREEFRQAWAKVQSAAGPMLRRLAKK